jgi:hypothetical protein
MATSLSEIEQFLKEENLRYTLLDEYIRTSFATDSYVDAEGDKSIFVVIKPEESGEYFKLITPNLYSYLSGPHKAALFQALLSISWKTKLLQFEYDERDGEIRGIVEFPLEDANLTRRQLLRCINGMVQIIDEYHPIIMNAMRNGVIDFGETGTGQSLDESRLAEEYYSFIGKKISAPRGKLELEE